jgi:hypothetical protein
MSNGILIFAINSEFDYIKSAEFAAKQAKKYLNLPVTLVTNSQVESKYFDSVVIVENPRSSIRDYRTVGDNSMSVSWFNECRTQAYTLSPYDKTLLIDADYFMYNDSLKCMFDTDIEIACFDKINDLSGNNPDLVRIADISIPMVWATVVFFKKCKLAESVFSFMEEIKENWKYYSAAFLFRGTNYRNDYSLSVALFALTGYSTRNFYRLPGKLQTIFSNVSIVDVRENEIVYKQNTLINKVINTNVHCMNKLEIDRFYA